MSSTMLCRFCLSSEIPSKSINCCYHWMGNDEMYCKMLRETFNINLTDRRGAICDACVARLRDAHSFKKQVLSAEQEFHQRISIISEGNNFDAIEATPVMFESAQKKNKSEGIAESFSNTPDDIPENIRHKINTTCIIKNSNVTPFRESKSEGYMCFYCSETYLDPATLREHTVIKHNAEKSDYFSKLKSSDKHVKVDVTGLKCTMCAKNINDISSLKQHLIKEHGEKLFESAGDKMLPFKLKKDAPLQCAVCIQMFETFKMLHQHMNVHFRNFVCSECNAGFVTMRRLNFHKMTHSKGDFCCELCEKVFQSKSKLNFHVRGVHKGLWKRNKCPHCSEKFTDYYKKRKHMVQAHNVAKIEYRCNACDREFSTKVQLTNHTKSFHLQEKHYECNICNLKFYARRDLQRHMPKHLQKFECKICRKDFATKSTLKQHVRTHVACAVCGEKFKSNSVIHNCLIKEVKM